SPSPTLTAVPALDGLSETAARGEIEAAGLLPTEGQPVLTATGACTAGRVAAQEPPAGLRVPVGTAVTYHLCAAVVPPLEGLSEQEATEALRTARLAVRAEHVAAGGPLGQGGAWAPPAGLPSLPPDAVAARRGGG